MALRASKDALRKEIQAKIKLLTAEQKQLQSKKVEEKLFQLPVFLDSKRISVYLSTDSEISTDNIVKRILDDGKACFIPRYHGSVMEMVRLTSMKDWETLPLTKHKIKQPSLSEKREDALQTGGLDLVIVPGVGFTTSRDRLGHGGGYYDSFLSSLSKIQTKPVSTVALAFKEQIVPHIPVDSYDMKVDVVLYPD